MAVAVSVPDQPIAALEHVPADPEISPEHLRLRANEFLAREKFNRQFILPATDSHGELTVTYAVAGKDCNSAPTIIFIGGLYGGRYMATAADYICEKRGVRFVVADRPGMGGSTPVEPSQRLNIWLETVPALMRVLGAQQVAIGAHSCGVIYALNTVYAMPWILSPQNPRLYLFAPWVSPNHSGISYLSLSSYMPSSIVGSFDSVVRFVTSKVVPTVQFSIGLSATLSAPSTTSHEHRGGSDVQDRHTSKHMRDDLCREFCGILAAEAAARSQATMKALFSEDTSGANHECLLLLKKKVAGSWGPCESYQEYPARLAAKLREWFSYVQPDSQRDSEATAPDTSQSRRYLALKVFWAEKDLLIGKKGAAYFDECFQQFSPNALGSNADSTVLRYDSEVVPGSDHDTVCLPQYGALSQMLEGLSG